MVVFTYKKCPKEMERNILVKANSLIAKLIGNAFARELEAKRITTENCNISTDLVSEYTALQKVII